MTMSYVQPFDHSFGNNDLLFEYVHDPYKESRSNRVDISDAPVPQQAVQSHTVWLTLFTIQSARLLSWKNQLVTIV